jgi:hypothetical protein
VVTSEVYERLSGCASSQSAPSGVTSRVPSLPNLA